MPRSIDEGFREFLSKLTPSSVETEAAKRHRASIRARLETDFELVRFFRSGSFGNGTSISGYSDVDYIASIPRKNLKKKSSTTLRAVRDSLDTRFPNTGVAVRCPAVIVPFGTQAKESTEVVPADRVDKTAKGGHPIYDIADCLEDGWRRASPEAHNAWVRSIDKKHSGRVKPLIRFIKAWKYFREVPVSSFYLELRVTKYADSESSILSNWDVKRVLCHLRDIGLAKMHDPLEVSGYVAACRTQAQLDDAKSKLDRAANRATNALQAEKDGKLKDAFGWWDKLFAEKFPSYYR